MTGQASTGARSSAAPCRTRGARLALPGQAVQHRQPQGDVVGSRDARACAAADGRGGPGLRGRRAAGRGRPATGSPPFRPRASAAPPRPGPWSIFPSPAARRSRPRRPAPMADRRRSGRPAARAAARSRRRSRRGRFSSRRKAESQVGSMVVICGSPSLLPLPGEGVVPDSIAGMTDEGRTTTCLARKRTTTAPAGPGTRAPSSRPAGRLLQPCAGPRPRQARRPACPSRPPGPPPRFRYGA